MKDRVRHRPAQLVLCPKRGCKKFSNWMRLRASMRAQDDCDAFRARFTPASDVLQRPRGLQVRGKIIFGGKLNARVVAAGAVEVDTLSPHELRADHHAFNWGIKQ